MPEIFNPASLNGEPKKQQGAPEPPTTVKPVVKKKANLRKQSTVEAIGANFFASTVKEVGNYLLWDIFIPNFKEVVYELIDGSALMLLWGNENRDHRGRGKKKDSNPYYQTSYSAYYKGERSGYSKQPPRGPEFTEDRYGITFENLDREDAYRLRDSLIDWLEAYHEVPLDIAKAYAGIPEIDIPYLDKQVGWYSLAELKIKKRPRPGQRDSFAVELPAPERLD